MYYSHEQIEQMHESLQSSIQARLNEQDQVSIQYIGQQQEPKLTPSWVDIYNRYQIQLKLISPIAVLYQFLFKKDYDTIASRCSAVLD